MNNIVFYVLEFIVAFLMIFFFYKIVVIRKMQDTKKDKKSEAPTELKLFYSLAKLDKKKFSDVKMMNTLAVVNSFDVALILLATEVTDSIALKIVIAFVLIIIVMLASYKLLGLFYKKGMQK